jgi:pimeloyl-ACP methyl ester carboxylesterase
VRVTDDDRALLIAPSARFFAPGDRKRAFEGPTTIFIGDQDEYCDVDDAAALARDLGAHLRVFPGQDHHFLKSRRALAEAALPILAPEVAAQ